MFFQYLGLHLDRRLNWRKHIITKRKQFGIQPSKIGSKSQLSIENKLLLYKANQYGLRVSNFGAQPSIQTWK